MIQTHDFAWGSKREGLALGEGIISSRSVRFYLSAHRRREAGAGHEED
jgi:hypothetical protein